MAITFFSEGINFSLDEPSTLRSWIKTVIKTHGMNTGEVNYIFCSDDYLLQINQQYLKHDYFTDIITFDQSEEEGEIAGDIFISIDRVKENADNECVHYLQELKRVMIHGILHLLGYSDHTEADILEMRKKEESCLSLYPK